jgi:hypothetical protein
MPGRSHQSAIARLARVEADGLARRTGRVEKLIQERKDLLELGFGDEEAFPLPTNLRSVPGERTAKRSALRLGALGVVGRNHRQPRFLHASAAEGGGGMEKKGRVRTAPDLPGVNARA